MVISLRSTVPVDILGNKRLRCHPTSPGGAHTKPIKRPPHTQCAHSSCHTVLRHELVETEIRECGKHNHVYSNQDFRLLGNISLQETELQQLTQHLHEPMVEMNHELKMFLFLHRHYCFLRCPVRMLRDLEEIGLTDHQLNTKDIEDSGSS